MTSKARIVVGTATVRSEEQPRNRATIHRITIPELLKRYGISESNRSVTWAVDRDEEEALISCGSDYDDRFEFLNWSSVTRNGVTRVPRELVGGYTLFDSGEPVVFVASQQDVVNESCRVVPEDAVLDTSVQEFLDTFSPDS